MTSYKIKSRKTGNGITYTYENGRLKAMEISGDPTDGQYNFLRNKLPYTEEMLAFFRADKINFEVIEIPQDLSFEAFYKAYRYKVGKRVMTENAWKRLSEADKAAAITYIPKYNDQLKLTGAAKAYPSTYLNQRYWEN